MLNSAVPFPSLDKVIPTLSPEIECDQVRKDYSAIARERKNRILSRAEIETLIAKGHHIVIYETAVLQCDCWLEIHPGGQLAIKHVVGRDATDEMNALHADDAIAKMKAFQIGRIEPPWVNFVPPIQGGQFRIRDKASDFAVKSKTILSSTPDLFSIRKPQLTVESSPYLSSSIASGLCSDNNSVFRETCDDSKSSSASSIVSSDAEVEVEKTGLGHIDRRTGKLFLIDSMVYPPTDPANQEPIAEKYREMYKELKAQGLFNCNYTAYAIELTRYSLFFGLSLLTLQWGWVCTSAVLIGCFWHQLVFAAHDAGHMGITHGYQTDTLLGIFIADFLGGLSLGWWKRSHNVHHIVTNAPEHDPDIQLLPFFAITQKTLTNIKSTYYDRIVPYDAVARFMIPYQRYMYYPILLFGRFNLYRLSWEYLLTGLGPRKGPARFHRWVEIVFMSAFWYWFGYLIVYKSIPTNLERIAYVLISHMVTAPLHVQITLSHFAMSANDISPDESFAQKMLRTTMDVDCPQWLDWFHGGLQFQAIHHLYPRMPRHNLREAQKRVQVFCDEVKIPYALYGFVDGNKAVLDRLGEVGGQATLMADILKQAAIFSECQKSLADSEDFGMHH